MSNYERYFGFKRPVFEGDNEPYLYASDQMDDLAQAFADALADGPGLLTLRGPMGVGKSVAVTQALAALPGSTRRIDIGRFRLQPDEAIDLMLSELGEEDIPAGTIRKVGLLGRRLAEIAADAARVVAVVEDAARTGAETLAELEVLCGGDGGFDIGLIVCGDETLPDLLRNDKLRRFAQRTHVNLELTPLAVDEMESYLAGAIDQAGGDASEIVGKDVGALLHILSCGIPRTAGKLVRSSLRQAAADNTGKLTCSLLADVADSQYGIKTELPIHRQPAPTRAAPGGDAGATGGDRPAAVERSDDPPQARRLDQAEMSDNVIAQDVTEPVARTQDAAREAAPTDHASETAPGAAEEPSAAATPMTAPATAETLRTRAETDPVPGGEASDARGDSRVEVPAAPASHSTDADPATEDSRETPGARQPLQAATAAVGAAGENRPESKATEREAGLVVSAEDEIPEQIQDTQPGLPTLELTDNDPAATDDPDEPGLADHELLPDLDDLAAEIAASDDDALPVLNDAAPQDEAADGDGQAPAPVTSEHTEALDDLPELMPENEDRPEASESLHQSSKQNAIDAPSTETTTPDALAAPAATLSGDPAGKSVGDAAMQSPAASDPAFNAPTAEASESRTEPGHASGLPATAATAATSETESTAAAVAELPPAAAPSAEQPQGYALDLEMDQALASELMADPASDEAEASPPAGSIDGPGDSGGESAADEQRLPPSGDVAKADTADRVVPPGPVDAAPGRHSGPALELSNDDGHAETSAESEFSTTEFTEAEDDTESTGARSVLHDEAEMAGDAASPANDWDRDPTLAELKPDLDALELALAEDVEIESVEDFAGNDSDAENKTADAEPAAFPEITLDESINEKVNAEAEDLARRNEAMTEPAPAERRGPSDTDLHRMAADLSRATSLDEMDDKLAETLFGEEINLVASQILKTARESAETGAESAGKPASKAGTDRPSVPDSAAPSSEDAEARKAFEKVWGASPQASENIEVKSGNRGLDMSASQRLATVRALNAEMGKPAPAAPAKPSAHSPGTPPKEKPVPIEDQIDISMTATMKALKIDPKALEQNDEPAEEKKGGFFSRFRKKG